MTASLTLPMPDDVKIVVPDSLNMITSYVLREQGDWFEEEIKFLRKLLGPGNRIVDVGANYGTYTLSMARTVGPSGAVWAFEPASSTAALLAESIEANGFSHVVLVQKALSGGAGAAQLSLNHSSELNQLIRDDSAGAGNSETVELVALDDCMDEFGWLDIDFVKLDAEGEEAGILSGGERFFAENSPLVQYEVKAGQQVYFELINLFAARGYASYRLVPGLNVLVPFDDADTVDPYMLNLFCCKPDRAASLADAGFLVGEAAARAPAGRDNKWIEALAELPYGRICAGEWRATIADGRCDDHVAAALANYRFAKDATRPAGERFAALEDSFVRLKTLCARQPDHLRWSSFARIAMDYGARVQAVEALEKLCEKLFGRQLFGFGEPFLPPGEQFDSIDPGDSMTDWIAAAVLVELEKSSNFSSFYTGMAAIKRLGAISDLGFGAGEMKIRLELIQHRYLSRPRPV